MLMLSIVLNSPDLSLVSYKHENNLTYTCFNKRMIECNRLAAFVS